jgi:hypothetical protein
LDRAFYFSSSSISIIAAGVELFSMRDVVDIMVVIWRLGLTCDFWAENVENNCKSNKWKVIGTLGGMDKGKGVSGTLR